MSPIQEAHGGVHTDTDMTEAATSNYIEAVLRGSQELGDSSNSNNNFSSNSGGGIPESFSSTGAAASLAGYSNGGMAIGPSGNLLTAAGGAGLSQQALSQSSSAATESTSPPLPAASSVYGLGGPPPTYEQHMNALEQRQLPLQQVLQQQLPDGSDKSLSTTGGDAVEGFGPNLPPWSFGVSVRNDINFHSGQASTADQSKSLAPLLQPSTNNSQQPSQDSNPSMSGQLPSSLSDSAADGSITVPNQQHLLNLLNQRCLQQTIQSDFISSSSSSSVLATASNHMHQPPSPSSSSSLPPSPVYSNGNSQLQSSVPTTPKSLNTSSSTLESSPPIPYTTSDCVVSNNPTLTGIVANRPVQSVSEPAPNPPLSPISESSSGVGNNLSGGNTRSVSAAVSDESVAGDSGVFEASVKR